MDQRGICSQQRGVVGAYILISFLFYWSLIRAFLLHIFSISLTFIEAIFNNYVVSRIFNLLC